MQAIIGHSQKNAKLDRKLKEKELAALQARDEELDGLFERIYEDNVSGKLYGNTAQSFWCFYMLWP